MSSNLAWRAAGFAGPADKPSDDNGFFWKFADAMKAPFTGTHVQIDDILAEGDKVAFRVTQQPSNTGPLVGLPAFGRLETPVPPTGMSILVGSIMIFKVADGRIISYVTELDQIGLGQQLG